MKIIDIGFVENCESWEVESRFFPSKVGGKPAWLDLKNLPDKDEIACEYCKIPCIFLCQIYAPYEEEQTFHRTLFIFICKNPDCCKSNQNGNLKIFRSQLEKINEFYSPDPPEDDKNWRTDAQVSKWRKTCCVCGILSESHCAKCKMANYCCREHQVLDWRNFHKQICGTGKDTETKHYLFPEFKLVMKGEGDDSEDEEDEEKEEEKEESENDDDLALSKNTQEMKIYADLVRNKKAGCLHTEPDENFGLTNFHNKNDDETFFKFQNHIRNDPDQVIRYEKGGYPLYISSLNKAENIPKCEKCNSERQFEFQIMPQLLNYLKFEDTFKCLDWGIIAVFTCKRSCVTKAGYTPEWIWKQDITETES